VKAHSQPRSDKRRLTRALGALRSEGPEIGPDRWIELAALAEQVASVELARNVIGAADSYQWSFDSRAFAAMATLCGALGLRDEFGHVLNGCRAADWPLDDEGWTAFLTSAEKINVRGFAYQIIAACDARGWKLSSAGWSCWVRLTGLQGGEPTAHALDRLLEQVPSLPIETLGSVLGALGGMTGTSDAIRGARLLSIVRRILDTRHTADWARVGTLADMIQIAGRWGDGSLMQSIVPALRADRLTADSVDSVIAFTLTYFRTMKKTVSAAIHAARLLTVVLPAFQGDERSRLRVGLLLRVLAKIGSVAVDEEAMALPARAGDLGFEITADDLDVVTAAVDQDSLEALLSRLDQFLAPLSEAKRTEVRHKLRALLQLLGSVAAKDASLVKLGQIFRREHDYSGALDLFAEADRIARNAKTRSTAAYEMGQTLLEQGRPREALAHFRRSADISPMPFPRAVIKAAEAAKRSGEYVIAMTLLEDLIHARRRSKDFSLHSDGRTLLQLGNTIIAGVEEQRLPAIELQRATEIAIDFFRPKAAPDDRPFREAALLAVKSLSLQERHAGPLSTEHPVLLLLATDPRPESVGMLCEAITEYGAWNDPILDALLDRVLRSDGKKVIRRSVVRCLSAAMTTAYHRGSLAGSPYIQAVQRLFRRILRALAVDRASLIFELFLARRVLTLRLVLEHYAAMAEGIMAVFFKPDVGPERRSELRKALTDINGLLAEQMPTSLRPAGYGGSDVIALAPWLAKFASRIDVRAGIITNRGEVRFRDRDPAVPVECIQLEWLRLRAAIESLIPLASGSPFRALALLSVPWYVDMSCIASAVLVELRFPSEIHPQHDPPRVLQLAAEDAATWARDTVTHGCIVSIDLSRWDEDRIALARFTLTPAPSRVSLVRALEPFTGFLAGETRKFLSELRPSPPSVKSARRLFDDCDSMLLFQGETWLALYHQHLMDVQFVTTAEWLFVGETLAEAENKPKYHPRYEVHSLKRGVASALADVDHSGAIQQHTLDDLRRRLVEMRQNILQAMRQVAGDMAGNPNSAIDVVGIVNETISKLPISHDNSINVAVTGPLYLLARADAPSLQAALTNVLLNAVEAVESAELERLIIVDVGADDPTWVWITIANPCDPATPVKAHGFGLGLPDARFHVETVNGGSLEAGPTGEGWYNVRIQLHRWVHPS
jgi:tetratricopeptide (TPR) repeat protein